jgi:predicted membrane GTPase involved in stress response
MLCRPDWVIDQTFDLFVELGANDNQCDFPVVYASGVNGIAGDAIEDMSKTLEPLFEAVVREVHFSFSIYVRPVSSRGGGRGEGVVKA